MVLFVLAEAANGDTDECWPSMKTICKRAGLRQERYATKALNSLTAAGLITVDPNGCPDHRIRADRRPNLFRLTGPVAVAHDPARRADDDPTTLRDAPNDPARRAPTTLRDAQTSLHIEPEVEPSLEPEPVRSDSPAVFAAWWERYPRRNGKRDGRAEAQKQWSRLSDPQRGRAWRNVSHYADACAAGLTIAKDAFRWLRPGAAGGFEDWDEPARPENRTGPSTRQQRKAEAMREFVGDEQPTGAVGAAFFGVDQQKEIQR